MMIKKLTLLLTISALPLSGLFLIGEVSAHGGATGVVKERMELMKAMGERMEKIGDMVKGKVAFDAVSIAASAGEIEKSAPEINHLFPEGSWHKPSEALPRIWEERERFDALAEQLFQEAGKLSDVATIGDQRSTMAQFVKLGKICSSCHTDFRKKEEK